MFTEIWTLIFLEGGRALNRVDLRVKFCLEELFWVGLGFQEDSQPQFGTTTSVGAVSLSSSFTLTSFTPGNSEMISADTFGKLELMML